MKCRGNTWSPGWRLRRPRLIRLRAGWEFPWRAFRCMPGWAMPGWAWTARAGKKQVQKVRVRIFFNLFRSRYLFEPDEKFLSSRALRYLFKTYLKVLKPG